MAHPGKRIADAHRVLLSEPVEHVDWASLQADERAAGVPV